jgi:AraC-like DNA-binding protein/ligand-binding sensor protein
MQTDTSLTSSGGDSTARSDKALVEHIRTSQLYIDYQKAFEAATGLPLTLREVGSFQSPLQGSKLINAFCAQMASQSKSCSACLQLQQRIESECSDGATTAECFAGLSDSAVPIKVGERTVAYLQTGQVFLHRPSEAGFRRLGLKLAAWNLKTDQKTLKAAYFNTRVIGRAQYDSVLGLLSIFAQHLSGMGNQIVVTESTAEAPEIGRARSFIAEHQGEEISLTQVARAVNMSSFYFCKVFKRATGLTFTGYLARVRVEGVKHILLNPHKRVSEAAFEAGFQSLSQFNRVFRRIAGEAPSNYRERLHGSSEALQAECAA